MNLLRLTIAGLIVSFILTVKPDGPFNAQDLGRMASDIKGMAQARWTEFRQGYVEREREAERHSRQAPRFFDLLAG